MAEEKETLLYEVVLNIPQVKEKAEVALAALSRLRIEKAATEKEFREKKIGAEEYGRSMLTINTAIERTSNQLKGYQKTLANNEKVQNSAKGSVNQLRAQVALLQAQFDGLSESEQKNEAVGGRLQAQIDGLNTTLLDLEKSTGRAQRQVGFYDKGLNDSGKTVTEYVKQVRVMGISVGDTIDNFKSGAQGATTFGKAVLSSRGALVALTAVPIILILTALVSFLTRSKDGMEFLARKTAAVTAVFDVFSQKFAGIGRFIVDAFDKPGEAISKLGDLIKENLTNRLNAFKVILDAVRTTDLTQLANGLIQLFTGVTNATGKLEELGAEARAAAAAGEALAKQSQLIADAERKLNVERANSRAQVEKLKLIGDDVSKSNSERLKATQQAFNIEQSLLNRQISLQKQRVANIRAENKLRGETKDGLDQLAEAESRIGELTEESTTRQIELNNKLNQIRIESAQQAINAQLAQLNENLRITRERGFQTLEIEKQILAKQLELELVGIVKGSEQEKALRLKYKSDLAGLILNDTIAQNERATRIESDLLQAQLELVQKGTLEELRLRKEASKQQEFQDEATARLTIKDAQQLEAQLTLIHAKGKAERAELDKQAQHALVAATQTATSTALAGTKAGTRAELEQRLNLIREEAAQELIDAQGNAEKQEEIFARMNRAIADAKKEFNQKQAALVLDSLSSVVDGLDRLVQAQTQRQQKLLDDQQTAALKSAGLSADARTKIEEKFAARKEDLERKSAERQRKIATAQNLIATARAITEAQILPPPFDIIKTVLAIATGAAQQAVIASQQFGDGGVIDGPSHAQGGVKYNVAGRRVELEGNEGVINKRSMAIPGVRQKASELNQLGGGVAFPGTMRITAAGRPPRYNPFRFEYGGVISGATGGSSVDYNQMRRVFVDAVRSLPPQYVRVGDIRNGVGRQVQVETRADTGV